MHARALVAAALLLPAAGCHTWQPVPPATLQEFLQATQPQPDRLRFERADGQRTELRAPYVVYQDSLRGVFWASRALARSADWSYGANDVAFAVEDIRRAEARRLARGRTVGLTVGVVLVSAVALVIVTTDWSELAR